MRRNLTDWLIGQLGIEAAESAGREQLHPVAPGIGGVEAARAWNRLVPLHGAPGASKSLGDQVEARLVDTQRGVRPPGRGELLDHSDVKLLRVAGKPDATTAPESLWLVELDKA